MGSPDLCVIFNPASGKRRGRVRLEKALAGTPVEYRPTQAPGHAVELARQAALDGFRVVAAAGGDGTVHEVVNGLMLAGRPDVRFALIPIGSANDYAFSLGRMAGTSEECRVDVGRVRDGQGRVRYFACNLGVGLNSAVTWYARRIHWLQGQALYGLATLLALTFRFHYLPLDIAIDDAPFVPMPTLMLTVLTGLREGGFLLAPRALLDDGKLDYLHAGRLGRLGVLRLLPRLALQGAPARWPHVLQGTCRRLRLRSPEPLLVHADGEFFCEPADRVRELEIDILPGALAVQRSCFYDNLPSSLRVDRG